MTHFNFAKALALILAPLAVVLYLFAAALEWAGESLVETSDAIHYRIENLRRRIWDPAVELRRPRGDTDLS